MKKLNLLLCLLTLLSSTSVFAASLNGRVFAYHDEWALTDTGYANVGSTRASTFALNIAEFLKGTPGVGNFLVYSDSIAFTQSNFISTLTGAGHTVDVVVSSISTLPDLSSYDGVFLSNAPGGADAVTLTNYVDSDRGVMIAAGNSYIPNIEAGNWNPFLNTFGLAFDNNYNGLQGNYSTISNSHSIFDGVNMLYYDNGNNVTLFGANPNASLVLYAPNSPVSLAGIYNGASAAVPEPASLTLLALGAFGLAKKRRPKA